VEEEVKRVQISSGIDLKPKVIKRLTAIYDDPAFTKEEVKKRCTGAVPFYSFTKAWYDLSAANSVKRRNANLNEAVASSE
jgi:hypothetical protein